jgi:hypothetical protein
LQPLVNEGADFRIAGYHTLLYTVCINAHLFQKGSAAAGPVGGKGHVIGSPGLEGGTVGQGGNDNTFSAGLGYVNRVVETRHGIEVIRQAVEGPSLLLRTGIVTGNNPEDVVSRLGHGIDPAVVGGLQVPADLLSRHRNHIQLVLKGIEGEKVVEKEGSLLHAAVVG